MPHHFKWNQEHRTLLVTFRGAFTEQEFQQARTESLALAAARDAAAMIIDFSEVSEFRISAEKVRAIAHESPITRRTRIAVAPQPEIFGSVRMVQLSRAESDPNLHVVRSMEEACAMLGAPAMRFEPVGPSKSHHA